MTKTASKTNLVQIVVVTLILGVLVLIAAPKAQAVSGNADVASVSIGANNDYIKQLSAYQAAGDTSSPTDLVVGGITAADLEEVMASLPPELVAQAKADAKVLIDNAGTSATIVDTTVAPPIAPDASNAPDVSVSSSGGGVGLFFLLGGLVVVCAWVALQFNRANRK